MSIPKKIMQTWKTHEVPDHWKPSPKSIQKNMGSWEYCLMSDEDNRSFVKQHFPDFLETFDSFPYPIQRADAIRYMWLYMNGGLYLDLDIELNKDLSPLFFSEEKDMVYLVESPDCNVVAQSVTNAFMASTPKNPFWLDVMEEMKKPAPFYVRAEYHYYILYSTGPIVVTRVMEKLKHKYKVLPKEVFPYSMCATKFNDPKAWTQPLPGNSWVHGYWATVKHCYCNATITLLIILLIFFLILGLIVDATFQK